MSNHHAYSDKELAYLLKDSDEMAFTEIYHRFYGVLYHHAYKSLPDSEAVKDVLQEVFVYLWNNRDSINPEDNLAAYLYTSVRNKVLNNFRHLKIKKDYIASFQNYLDSNSQPEADEAIRIKQLIAIVEAEITKLPAQMRLIFQMSRNNHLSHQEIADQLNLSVLTVRKQVNNSLKILRLKLGSKFFFLFL
ncbi:RNA polymerase sigma-70 factor [Mucilaginibacter sp. SG564]|uniref:RNA polymerase sigma-70 factor n=1 Tax=unclassified Mucilaginibacter TaxID=2617802 RepID=UPI00155397D8|nr:RNA polymerase sigma-70 factor [Mucilaginibacter sp. SG564]NOW98046.1 RNA polymerase sigma-70 factor (ECF subfamily) [Mucilaginibacter sp. SG564]